MTASSIATFILALLRLAPPLYQAIGDQLQREREARALQRQQEKDSRVDDAIEQANSQEAAESAEKIP